MMFSSNDACETVVESLLGRGRGEFGTRFDVSVCANPSVFRVVDDHFTACQVKSQHNKSYHSKDCNEDQRDDDRDGKIGLGERRRSDVGAVVRRNGFWKRRK